MIWSIWNDTLVRRFRFPLLRNVEKESASSRRTDAGKKEEEEKILGIGHDRAHVRISRLGGGRG